MVRCLFLVTPIFEEGQVSSFTTLPRMHVYYLRHKLSSKLTHLGMIIETPLKTPLKMDIQGKRGNACKALLVIDARKSAVVFFSA